MQTDMDMDTTQELTPVRRIHELKQSVSKRTVSPRTPNVETLLPPTFPDKVPSKRATRTKSEAGTISKQELEQINLVRAQCRKACLSAFFRKQVPIRSLGFTSSVASEGKSFLALVTAGVLADESGDPVVLLDCNWDNPSLHHFFCLPEGPGLAEWLRGECKEMDVRYQIGQNLSVIPAGDGGQDAVRLLQRIYKKGLLSLLSNGNERVVADLPAITTTSYGRLAASIVEALMVVVCAGVTTEDLLADTLAQLATLPVQGVILNRIETSVPRWLRRMF